MRKIRTAQVSIFEVFAEHEIGRELQAMSAWLDEHPELLVWAGKDLGVTAGQQTGREGMTAESVLRCGLLKQYCQLSYEELASRTWPTAEDSPCPIARRRWSQMAR